MHPHFYSIYSHIDRYHLDKKYSLDVVSSFIKVVEEIDYDAERGRLDKPKYNEFNYVEFLNYIPLNTISDIVLNQFKTYIETVPFSNLTLFIKEYYNSFIYECEVLLQLIENGQLTWWDSKGNFDFYNYSQNIYEYNMIVWESKTSNDLHFYELYLKSLIQLLNNDIIEQYNNSQLSKTNEPINEVFDDFNFNKDLPYKIALLNEIGFFEMESIKKLTKESQYKIISKLTGGTIRTIKGNVLVLNPNSNEDPSRYTSNNYIDVVKLDLNKLK